MDILFKIFTLLHPKHYTWHIGAVQRATSSQYNTVSGDFL